MRFQLAAFADEAADDLRVQIAAMRQNDIRYLEIRGVDGQNIADISAEKAREIRRQLDDAGIAVWSVGSPFGKISISEDFVPHLDQFRRCLDTALILGASCFRLFSFYGTNEIAPVVERLGAFLDAAKGSGITLCHENEKGIYGDTAAKCLALHHALPALKAVFDPANFVQCGQDTKEAWAMLSAYVEYMHIKDARADGTVVPAGEGVGALPYLLSQYRGSMLTVEPHLTVFHGLESLETVQKSSIAEFVYPDSLTAFSAAVDALRSLIGRT